MRVNLLAIGALWFAGSAQAGCYYFNDAGATVPAPVVDICYAGACDRTTTLHECGNVHAANTSFAVGWGIAVVFNGEGVADDEVTVSWDGRAISRDRWANLSCQEVSGEGGCRFFDLLN